MTEVLTSNYYQGCETGEGGNVQLHAVERLRKLQDGVNPVTKASDTLHFVKHSPVAEDELVRFRIRTSKENITSFIDFIQGIRNFTCRLCNKLDEVLLLHFGLLLLPNCIANIL